MERRDSECRGAKASVLAGSATYGVGICTLLSVNTVILNNSETGDVVGVPDGGTQASPAHVLE